MLVKKKLQSISLILKTCPKSTAAVDIENWRKFVVVTLMENRRGRFQETKNQGQTSTNSFCVFNIEWKSSAKKI